MPKANYGGANPFGAHELDEDEKTTIESGWEEEASTTVEQGDVAEKIRALGLDAPRRGNTSVTSTNAGMMDEPTVDDQRANAVIAMLPPPNLSRLVVTNGSDTGHELEVRAGKSYTIGRGMDNDLVLSDIAVSRKHFDLRSEHGQWLICDRGSGNGTLVNGNLEDAPFVLASGDQIEIGNTVFRFDQPNGVARAAPMPRTVPVRKSEPATYDVSLDEELEPSTMSGKPMRAESRPEHRAETRAEHPPEPRPRMSEPIALVRPKTLPPPAPLPRPLSPSRLPTSQPVPVPPYAMEPRSEPRAPSPLVPAAAPHAPTMAAMQVMQQPTYPVRAPSYPPYGMAPPQMLASDPGLGPISHAHSQPLGTTIPGQGVVPPYGMSPPMLVVASNALQPRDATSTAQVPPTPYGGQQIVAAPIYAPPQLSRRVKLALGGIGLTLLAAVATIAIIKGSSKHEPPKAAVAQQPAVKQAPVIEHIEPPTVTPVNPPPPPVKVVTPPPPPPEKIVTAPPPPPPPPVKVVTPPPPPVKIVKDTPKEPKRTPKETPKEPKRTPKEPPPERVAVADPPRRTPAGGNAKAKADSLYQAHKFNEAAQTLKSAASGAPADEASQLKSLAATYEQLGKAYSVGMGPATPAVEAYLALRRAQNFDHTAGNMLQSEINEKLGAVASKAAVSYNAKHENENAYQAVLTAERLGAGNNSTKTVRDILEGRAGDLYGEASKLMNSDASAAKQKLREITHMVDSKSPWYQKASKLLASS